MKLLSKTEKLRSNRFKWGAALALGLAGLASFTSFGARADAASSPTAVPAHLFDSKFKGDGFEASLSSDTAYNGSIVVVRVDLDKQAPISGKFEGIALPFFPAPEFSSHSFEAVLGVPYDHAPGPVHIDIQIGKDIEFSLGFKLTEGVYGSEKLTVAPGKVNPKKKDMIRIQKEQKEISPIYKLVTEKKYWSGPFDLPIHSKVRSEFGTKRLYNGEPRSFHPGVDLTAPMNTPIHSPAAGVVVLAKNLFFTGNTVILDHGYGVITLYAHMTTLKVKKGDVVKAGTLLGLSGKTGRVTGPHLHWGAIIHGQKVNPLELTKVMK